MCSSKKLNQRGGFFVEYALILAFVVICGNALLTNNEISLKINNIITSTTDLLQKAVGLTSGTDAPSGEQGTSDTNTPSTSKGQGSIHASENGLEHGKGHNKSTEQYEGPQQEGMGGAGQVETPSQQNN